MGSAASTLPRSLTIPSPKVEEKLARSFNEQYSLGDKLGKGAFAQVRMARAAGEKEAVAVKILDIRDNLKNSTEKVARHEVNICKQLGQSPHVVFLVDAFIEMDFAYLVMEKCESNLLLMLERAPLLTEQVLAQVFRSMLLGIAHVHSRGVVHRDIKPDNFLHGGGGDLSNVKLCDLGLAETLPPDGQGHLEGVHGTAPFMSPEMLSTKMCNAATDVWSFAVCMYVLMYGEFPYTPKDRSAHHMKKAIVDNYPKPPYAPTERLARSNAPMPTDTIVSCMQRLLCRDPLERPTAAQALQMPPLIADPSVRIEDGPSFRTALQQAKRAGAFDTRSLHRADGSDVDSLLQELQLKHRDSRMMKRRGCLASKVSRSTADDVSTEAGSDASDSDASCMSR